MQSFSSGTMDMRTRVILRIGVILGIIIAVILLLLLFRSLSTSEPETSDQVPVGDTSQPTVVRPIENTQPLARNEAVAQEVSEDVRIKQAARLFAERYGTRSNQNNNRHIDDVSSLVTDRMRDYIMSQTLTASSSYEGVTNKVVSQTIVEKEDTAAVVELGLQQQVSGQGQTSLVYSTARINLLEQDGQWLIDGYFED